MRRAAEFAVFALLAAGLHLAAAGLAPMPAGVEGAGQAGEGLTTLRASDARLAALVERWETPPDEAVAPRAPPPPAPAPAPTLPRDVARSAPIAAPRPPEPAPRADDPPDSVAMATPLAAPPQMEAEVALPARPEAVPDPAATMSAGDRPPEQAPPARPPAPQAATPPGPAAPPPPPPPERADPLPSTRPPPRPPAAEQQAAPRKAPAAQVPSRAAQPERARGEGGGQSAGAAARPAPAATLSAGERGSRLARWGAELRRRVEGRKRYPRDGRRAAGTVTVRLTVARDGRLAGVAVARSSGHAALDRAALAAVRAAGRFPPAPEGLGDPSYTFALPMRYSPR